MRLLAALCLFAAAAAAGAQQAAPLALSWDAPTENVDGSPITLPLTYNVYRSRGGRPYTEIRTGISKTQTTVATNLVSGEENCFYVVANEVGELSGQSLPACKTVP